jgi:outer membrane protein TolC
MRNSLPSLLAIALLSACASTHQLRPEAAFVPANSLQMHQSLSGTPIDTAAWPKAQWWTVYGDTQLNDLINEALAGSPGLRIAEARTRAALAQVASANSARAPSVRATGTRWRY